MKKINITATVTFVVMILIALLFVEVMSGKNENQNRHVIVGFVYDGDESTPYTGNFIRVEKMLSAKYGDQIEIRVKSNSTEDYGKAAIGELVAEGCDIIFTTSYGYGVYAKEFAKDHPEIEFCQATCSNANEEPVLPNYHTFMGEIYEGRYVAGLVAGMKLKEMLDQGVITQEEAKIGYVGAFPYAEVISGYTAFFLGVREIVPTAVMTVRYTDTWSNYSLEKEAAEALIREGCVIISQHSDTIGPAVACESSDEGHPVYHVGYNQSMIDIAPTTSLVSCRINWAPYIMSAVEAVIAKDRIEDHVDANIHGNDAGASFEKDWVQMVELNTSIAAKDSQSVMENAIRQLEKGKIHVFSGEYVGTDPFDPEDEFDLRSGYRENENTSAPTFHYVLDDVITVSIDPRKN